jgi:predicted Rossmann-fold nucleotide-binding protein
VVLVGKDYWSGLLDWLRRTLAAEGKVDLADLDLFHLTDDPAEVLRIIRDAKSNGATNDGESHYR